MTTTLVVFGGVAALIVAYAVALWLDADLAAGE